MSLFQCRKWISSNERNYFWIDEIVFAIIGTTLGKREDKSSAVRVTVLNLAFSIFIITAGLLFRIDIETISRTGAHKKRTFGVRNFQIWNLVTIEKGQSIRSRVCDIYEMVFEQFCGYY